MGDISLPCKDITDCIHHHEFARRLKMRADSIGARVYSEYHHSMRKKNGEHFLEKGEQIIRLIVQTSQSPVRALLPTPAPS